MFTSLNHPKRIVLASEAHARPVLSIDLASSSLHFVVYRDGKAQHYHDDLSSLCQHWGISPPDQQARYFFHDTGHLRLKWEGHSEFCTFTFTIQSDIAQLPFTGDVLRFLPKTWLQGLQQSILSASIVCVQSAHSFSDVTSIQSCFIGQQLVASQVFEHSELWTDFQIQPDGLSRFLVVDRGLSVQQIARLVQLILEIETYRMMAMLAWPLALGQQSKLKRLEDVLARISTALVESDSQQEQALLYRLSRLAATADSQALQCAYRFSAAKAYFQLVNARISALQEQSLPGWISVGEFMNRRLAPAMATCEHVAVRQEKLATRIARTNDLLRTRVSLTQEQQNRDILQSMNQRAKVQLHLQQTVEGLSTVAITYYSLGIIHRALEGMHAAGVSIDPSVGTALALPLLLLGIWFSLRKLRRWLLKERAIDIVVERN